jgi:MerR family transcriptional regulator/heat shock protein HspR
VTQNRVQRDPGRPVYVISVAASIVSVHPRTLRIYEDEGLVCPARTPSNNRLYSEDDIRRVMWIRHLTRDRGVNLAGIRLLFELEERLGTRILEALFDEGMADRSATAADSGAATTATGAASTTNTTREQTTEPVTETNPGDGFRTHEPETSNLDEAPAPSDTNPATGTPVATPRRA